MCAICAIIGNLYKSKIYRVIKSRTDITPVPKMPFTIRRSDFCTIRNKILIPRQYSEIFAVYNS